MTGLPFHANLARNVVVIDHALVTASSHKEMVGKNAYTVTFIDRGGAELHLDTVLDRRLALTFAAVAKSSFEADDVIDISGGVE